MNHNLKSLTYMVADALAVAIIFLCVKSLAKQLPIFELIFFKNIICFVAVVSYLLIKKESFVPKKSNIKWLVLRCLAGLSAISLQFYTIKYLTLADAAILAKTAPFFITLIGCIFLNEKLQKIQIPALILSFVGVLFIVRPGSNFHFDVSLVALVSALLAAISYSLVSFLNRHDERTLLIILYFTVGNVLGSVILMHGEFVMPNLHQGLILLVMGISFVFGQFSLTRAYKYAPASEVSIYSFITVIASTAMAAVLWGEWPKTTTWLGGCLILIAACLTYVYNRKKALNMALAQ